MSTVDRLRRFGVVLFVTMAPPDLFDIAELVNHFGGRGWIASKTGPRIQSLTRRWLLRHRVFKLTGHPKRVLFSGKSVLRRPVARAIHPSDQFKRLHREPERSLR